MKNYWNNFKSKYRNFKNSIPVKTGKLIERITFYKLIIIVLLIIPILFTLLSTLAGSGAISLLTYHIVFYIVWTLELITFIVWLFFKEFRKNKI